MICQQGDNKCELEEAITLFDSFELCGVCPTLRNKMRGIEL